MAGRLEGKVAIVTGAGQRPGSTPGNGRATAIRFAEEGAVCLLVDREEAWARETLDIVGSDGGSSVIVADVTREAECATIVAAALERYGRIDILHNNVGLSKGDRATPDLESETWDQIMAVNLKSMFLLCKHALPSMRERRSGSIVNISSTSSLSKRPTVAYKTSKGAINTLTQHVAAENAAFNIRANAIVPGLIDTPMAIERRAEEAGRPREEIRAERDALVPMGFMGEAWDVANAAVFLASDEARYVTGILLPVDGGLLLKRG